MSQDNNHPILRPTEQARLIISAALVATAIAAIQALPESNNLLITFVKGIFVISALSGFLFILLSAAMLKFSKTDQIFSWPFTEKFRKRCYDYCIDSYGVQLGSLIMFGSAYVLGWDFKKDVWDWKIGAGALLTLSLFALIVYIVRYRDSKDT